MARPKFVREFLYVDVDRVRSLLAQVEGGIVNEIRSHGGHVVDARVQGAVLGVGANAGYQYQRSSEESRSLQDLTFVAFEEAAEQAEMIVDLSSNAHIRDPRSWKDGTVHGMLSEGQIVRLVADVQLLDGGLFRTRVERLMKMVNTMVDLRDLGLPASAKQRDVESARNRAKQELMGDTTDQTMSSIAAFVEAFVGDSIALRVAPCGEQYIDLCFSGALLNRDEYIQQEREHLFSRYGAALSRWTAILQVAAIPDNPAVSQSEDDDQTDSDNDLTDEEGNIDRVKVESMAIGVLKTLEGVGLMEGPRWPAVSVTPLGIYRSTLLKERVEQPATPAKRSMVARLVPWRRESHTPT